MACLNITGVPFREAYVIHLLIKGFQQEDFAAYIEKRKSMIVTTDPAIFINRSIEAISNDQIIQYENQY